MGHGIFVFAHILRETRALKEELERTLAAVVDVKVAALAKEASVVALVGATADSPPLTLAFVGQYNAGKSTILRALTGRSDILIDADVCTDQVTAYDWGGIRLLDTPGIHAGYPDHDESTYAAIDRADLVVFVVTNELFDDTIGHHFRELAFGRNKAREILLVVNKMSQNHGSPEVKRPDLEKVTQPLKCEDFRTVFIDALSFLEAADTLDDEERQELLQIANLDELIAALNQFVMERGCIGRLTTPLFMLRALAEQAMAYLSVDYPEERGALELLHRKRSLLLASRGRLRSVMLGIVSRAVGNVGRYGDKVAESIEPGRTEEDVERLHEAAQRKARERCDRLAEDTCKCIENEFEELRRQLQSLKEGILTRTLRGRVGPEDVSDVTNPIIDLSSAPRWDINTQGRDPADWLRQAKKIGDIANDIGNWAGKWASGPMAGSAKIGSATAARGSQAHRVVYDVGKFFGVKFKPYGAVNVAQAIGKAGHVIAAAAGVLTVIAQIFEDKQQAKYHSQLRNARDGVRSAYRDFALAVEADFRDQFELFLKDFYDSELEAINAIVHDLASRRIQRSEAAKTFKDLAIKATEIIQGTHTFITASNQRLLEISGTLDVTDHPR